MYCRNCGQELREDSVFCNACGNKLEYQRNIKVNESNKPKKSIAVICVFSFVALLNIFCGLIILMYSLNDDDSYIRRGNSGSRFDSVFYGLYEQDGDESNGREPIEWMVLDEDNEKMLLISKYIIDVKECYLFFDAGWAKSGNRGIRGWLNEDFYKNAFTLNERKRILETELKTPDYIIETDQKTQDGIYEESTNDMESRDKVFLLSLEEARRYFPLVQIDEKSECSSELIATPTTFVQQYYEKDNSLHDFGGDGKCNEWALRTRSLEIRHEKEERIEFAYLCEVDNNGCLRGDRYWGRGLIGIGIRPVIWIKK